MNQLFQEERYQELLDQIKQQYPNDVMDIETRNLKAKSLYHLAFEEKNEQDFKMKMTDSVNTFSVVLRENPHHEEALLFRAFIYNDYLIDNDPLLWEDALKIEQLNDFHRALTGKRYLANVLTRKDETQKGYEKYQEMIDFTIDYRKVDFSTANIELNCLYKELATLVIYLSGDSKETASCYEKAIEVYPYNHQANYEIAKWAFDNGFYTLSGKAAYEYFIWLIYNEPQDNGELIAAMYQFIIEGNQSIDIFVALINGIANSNFFPFQEDLDYINFIRKNVSVYNENHFIYGRLGSEYYKLGDYKAALNAFEKSLNGNQPSGNWLAKWIISYVKVYNKYPEKIPAFQNDSAMDWYSGGVVLAEFSDYYQGNATVKEALEMQVYVLYKTSYNLFHEYFFSKKGSHKCNSEHYFAMCCNNFALRLKEQKRLAEAVDIHKMGYQLSPFSEQLVSLIYAQYDAQLYKECIETIEKLYHDFGYDISIEHHYTIQHRLVFCYKHLEQWEKMWQQINHFEKEWNELHSHLGNYEKSTVELLVECANQILAINPNFEPAKKLKKESTNFLGF